MIAFPARIQALSALIALLLALCAAPARASGHLHQHRAADPHIKARNAQPHAEQYRQAVKAALAAKRAPHDVRRNMRKRGPQTPLQLCPGTLQACTLPSGSFECRESIAGFCIRERVADYGLCPVDTSQELNACGACLEQGGMDCEAIPNVELVTCALSRCEIRTSILVRHEAQLTVLSRRMQVWLPTQYGQDALRTAGHKTL